MIRDNKVSFILNLFIFIFVLPCAILSFTRIQNVGGGLTVIKYFTVQSNIVSGITSLIFVIYYILISKKKTAKIPKLVYVLKFVATIDLLLTFFTVLFFLAPTISTGFFSLYAYTNFFFHFLVPVLTFVSFVFFESEYLFSFRITFIGMIHFICYSIFYFVIAVSHLGKNGEVPVLYDWYGYSRNGVTGMIISIIVTFIGTYLCSLFLWWICNKMHNKKSAKR